MHHAHRRRLPAVWTVLVAALATPALAAPPPKDAWNLLAFGDSKAHLDLDAPNPGNIRVTVDHYAAEKDWMINISRPIPDIQIDTHYRFEFQAKSTADRPLVLVFMQNQKPFQPIAPVQRIELTPEWQYFEVSFRPEEAMPMGRLQINMGGSEAPVEITDFRLTREEIDLSDLDSKKLLPEQWRLSVFGDCEASLDVEGGDGVVSVDITKATSLNEWQINLVQSGIHVLANSMYSLKFRARASDVRPISLQIDSGAPPWKILGLKRTITITPEWKEYQAHFSATQTCSDGRIVFLLGGSGTDIEISDVRIDYMPHSQRTVDRSTSTIFNVIGLVCGVGILLLFVARDLFRRRGKSGRSQTEGNTTSLQGSAGSNDA